MRIIWFLGTWFRMKIGIGYACTAFDIILALSFVSCIQLIGQTWRRLEMMGFTLMVNPMRCAYETDLVVGRREDWICYLYYYGCFYFGIATYWSSSPADSWKAKLEEFLGFFFLLLKGSKQASSERVSFYNGSWTWSIAASCFTRADDVRRITMVLGPALACANQLLPLSHDKTGLITFPVFRSSKAWSICSAG